MGYHFVKISDKEFVKYLYKKLKEDEVTGLSAQIAYFLLLSIIPFLIFGITLLAYLPISTHYVIDLFKNIAPIEMFELVQNAITSVLDTKRGDILSMSILMTLWTASNGINAIIKALNKAYNAVENRGFILNRLISVLLVLGLVSAVGIALILSVFGNLIGKYLFSYLGVPHSFLIFWNIARILGSFALLVLIFALLYFIAPNKKLKWKEIFAGSIFAAIGWVLVSLVFSFYVNNFGNYSATYGSLGGVIILMLWLYLSGMILIIGGEINATAEYFRQEGLKRETA
ncbi:YihY/virulence factor BrkB family protein [Irregularibacter muris]|uniref:YihY/virulence factor BrkB family protein n=1 Tax=Irregularibacter muris TaxID=1796619 RepID=A0AAE3HE29_9FIRM|nr:YihY/virulence factor BrkB family protein [Irregularibacter muris]MCR1897729.1 YihY/virulence factor BrkB family protein [Irregularibacter muris]